MMASQGRHVSVIALVTLTLFARGLRADDLQEGRSWPGGFLGVVSIPVTNTINGWTAHLVFSSPVLFIEVPQALGLKNVSDTEFVLSSQDWSSHIETGQNFTLNIVGHFSDSADILPQLCVYIEGYGADKCSSSASMPATTTLRTTITMPTTRTTTRPTTTRTTTRSTTTTRPTTTRTTTRPTTTRTTTRTTTKPTTTRTTTKKTTTTKPTTTKTTTKKTTTTRPTTTKTTTKKTTTTKPTTTETTTRKTTTTRTTTTTTTTRPTTTTTTTRPTTATTTTRPTTATTTTRPTTMTTTTTTIMPTTTTKETTTTRATPTTTMAPQVGNSTKNYAEALRLSLLFYYAQRSGVLPANNSIPWRGDSALNDCVVGGWYDAGDHVKFGFPMTNVLTILLWGTRRFRQGYVAANQMDPMYDTVKWGLDYLLKAWDPFLEELVVQIGDADIDHAYWGRPEDMTMPRPCIKIGPNNHGSDVAGETVAALAAGAIIFKEKGDIAYSTELLNAAISVYMFASAFRGKFSDNTSLKNKLGYTSTDDSDEMCEAGVWLYHATGEEKYLVAAQKEFKSVIPDEFSWDDKMAACQLLLYEATAEPQYAQQVDAFLQSWQPGGQVNYTPCGLAWSNNTYRGSNRYAANVAFLALLAAEDGIQTELYRKWAAEQINYILGDNRHDGGCFSYEIGYGKKYPLQPHHRAASCPYPPTPCTEEDLHKNQSNPHILYGALVGGPDLSDSYNDSREDDVHNHVALDYNAGFQSALAGLVYLAQRDQLPDTATPCPCDIASPTVPYT